MFRTIIRRCVYNMLNMCLMTGSGGLIIIIIIIIIMVIIIVIIITTNVRTVN